MEKNREKFDTAFWQKAYDSLPPQARGRHARLLRAAERWELKLDAEVVLERLHLVAHRGLRDRELVRRLLEREVARGGFEHAQRIERRQAIDHVEFFLTEK